MCYGKFCKNLSLNCLNEAIDSVLLSAVKDFRPKPLVTCGAEFGKGAHPEPCDLMEVDHPDNMFCEDFEQFFIKLWFPKTCLDYHPSDL